MRAHSDFAPEGYEPHWQFAPRVSGIKPDYFARPWYSVRVPSLVIGMAIGFVVTLPFFFVG